MGGDGHQGVLDVHVGGWAAQRVCNDVGAARGLPAALHCLQADGVPPPPRGQCRDALLSCGAAHRPQHMDPHFLATLTSIAANKTACEPSWEKIKAKYFEKFRGKGGEGILEGEAGSSSDAGPSDLERPLAGVRICGSNSLFAAPLLATTSPSWPPPPSPSLHGHRPQPRRALLGPRLKQVI